MATAEPTMTHILHLSTQQAAEKPLDIPMMLASRTKIACTPTAQCQKDITKPTTPKTKPTVHATPCAIPQHERHLCSGGTFIWLRSGGDALEGARPSEGVVSLPVWHGPGPDSFSPHS